MPEIGSTTFPGLRISGDGIIIWVGLSAITVNLFEANTIGDTNPRFGIRGDGRLEWGPGNAAYDSRIRRGGPGVVTTTGTFQIYGGDLEIAKAAAANVSINSGVIGEANFRLVITADGKLAWGAGSAAQDCDFFRNAANELRTSDQFTALGGVATLVKAGVPADGDFATAIDGLLAIDSANSDFYVRLGGVWKKVAVA